MVFGEKQQLTMEICADFVEWLGPDTSTSVFMLLDDPADLVRASAVSRSWRRFVIGNSFCKKLCLRMCKEVSNFAHVTEVSSSKENMEVGSSTAMEWNSLEREHRIYAYLSHCLVSPIGRRECIAESIHASSTDNYPDESIENTLVESDRVNTRPSYWSSGGESDPGVPETLTYRLGSELCVINEIKIQPFEAYFQYGNPIYSAKAVRVRMGHSLSSKKVGAESVDVSSGQTNSGENYVWTYVSPEFPMVQENVLQSFKLPRPVICIGGIVQIELLGRVQVQEMDGLYYICVCNVQVIGRLLTPEFDVNILEPAGNSVLKYFPELRGCTSFETRKPCSWNAFRERIKHMRARTGWNYPILNTLLGNIDSDSDEEDVNACFD